MYQEGRLQLVWIAGLIVIMAVATAIVVWLPQFKNKVAVPPRLFSIAEDFSRFPGGPDGSPYCGPRLRSIVLWLLDKPGNLIIVLDGTWGYSSAFLESAFYKMAEEIPDIQRRLSFISEDQSLITEIWEYVEKV